MTCQHPECAAMFASTSGTASTCVGSFSPPGHDHDDNCRSREYTCDDGHKSYFHRRNRCPNEDCDWVGKAECFCHPGPKVDEWPDLGMPG